MTQRLSRHPRMVAVDAPAEWAPPGERSRPCEKSFAESRVCGIRFTPDADTAGGADPPDDPSEPTVLALGRVLPDRSYLAVGEDTQRVREAKNCCWQAEKTKDRWTGRRMAGFCSMPILMRKE